MHTSPSASTPSAVCPLHPSPLLSPSPTRSYIKVAANEKRQLRVQSAEFTESERESQESFADCRLAIYKLQKSSKVRESESEKERERRTAKQRQKILLIFYAICQPRFIKQITRKCENVETANLKRANLDTVPPHHSHPSPHKSYL